MEKIFGQDDSDCKLVIYKTWEKNYPRHKMNDAIQKVVFPELSIKFYMLQLSLVSKVATFAHREDAKNWFVGFSKVQLGRKS